MSAMVLFSFEQDLSLFIANRTGEKPLDFGLFKSAQSDDNRRRESDTFNPSDAYLDETFRAALGISKETSDEADLQYLNKIFKALDLYSVRNAIAHPVKPFLVCFWHRIATLATDPATEKLCFRNTVESYGQAIRGELIESAEQWFTVSHETPNNLPNETGHEMTGLIGRKTEIIELGKLLKNQRLPLISIVAPGGIGKTALLLDYLNALVLDETFANSIDCILYLSLKTEKLTPDGINRISNSETIEELKLSFAHEAKTTIGTKSDEFPELLIELAEKKVLLCIDNLETLFRDEPTAFDEFNYLLPQPWRVIVTSRVNVSSSTVLRLGPLQKNAGQHLARHYAIRRGLTLESERIEQIAEACGYNPLAIRLSVDLISRGIDLREALAKARQDVNGFSYGILLDHLSDAEIDVLESLMAENELDRNGICQFTGFSHDQAQEAINSLIETSLISCSYTSDANIYLLPSAVRDVLLTYSRAVARRKILTVEASKAIARIEAAKINTHNGLAQNRFDEAYIASDLPTKLQELGIKANRILFQRNIKSESLTPLIHEIKESIAINESWFSWRLLGRIHWKLANHDGWEESYQRSIELNSEEVFTKFLLASGYYASNQYKESENIYQELFDSGYYNPKNSTVPFAQNVCTGYFLTKIFQGKHEEVLSLTDNCPHPSLSSRYLLFRAGALKRKAEYVPINTLEHWELINRSISHIEKAVKLDGYAPHVRKVLKNIIVSASIFIGGKSVFPPEVHEIIRGVLNFSARHVTSAFVENTAATASLKHVVANFRNSDIEENIFNTDPRWGSLVEIEKPTDQNYEDSGLVYALVYNIAGRDKGYVFAQSDNKQQYYLHATQFQNGMDEWKFITCGQKVAIDAPEKPDSENKAIRAKLWFMA